MNYWICRYAVAVAGAAWVGIAAAQDVATNRVQADRSMRPEATGERVEHFLRMLDNPRIVSTLGLSDKQQQQIKDAAFAHQKKIINMRAELETAGIEQAKLISNESTDVKTLMNAVERTGKVRTEMAKLQIGHLVEVRGMLTADQRAKLRDLMRKSHERRGEDGSLKRRQLGEERHSGEKHDKQEDGRPEVGKPARAEGSQEGEVIRK